MTAKILKEYGWGIDAVKKHKDWISTKYPTGKDCPMLLIYPYKPGHDWDWFIELVKAELNK